MINLNKFLRHSLTKLFFLQRKKIFIANAKKYLSNSKLRQSVVNGRLSDDFIQTGFNELDFDSLYATSRERDFFTPIPFCISYELLLGLNLFLNTNDIGILKILRENIDALLKVRSFVIISNSKSFAWSFGYIKKQQLTIDYPTSASIYTAILFFTYHVGDNKYLKECETFAKEVIEKYFSNDNLDDFDALPTNQASIFLTLFGILYSITGEKTYSRLAKKIGVKIEKTFRFEGSCICWPYRSEFKENKSQFGERYWKSIFVIQSILISNELSLFFTNNHINLILNSFKNNLIRDDGFYDSLSRTSGNKLDHKMINYHKNKGQYLTLQKIMNYSILIRYDKYLLFYFKKIYLDKIFKSFTLFDFERNLFFYEGMSFIFFQNKNYMILKK